MLVELTTVIVITALLVGIQSKKRKKEEEKKVEKEKNERWEKRRIEDEAAKRLCEEKYKEEERIVRERIKSKDASKALKEGFLLGCVLRSAVKRGASIENVHLYDLEKIGGILNKYPEIKKVVNLSLGCGLTTYGVIVRLKEYSAIATTQKEIDLLEGFRYGLRYGG